MPPPRPVSLSVSLSPLHAASAGAREPIRGCVQESIAAPCVEAVRGEFLLRAVGVPEIWVWCGEGWLFLVQFVWE